MKSLKKKIIVQAKSRKLKAASHSISVQNQIGELESKKFRLKSQSFIFKVRSNEPKDEAYMN